MNKNLETPSMISSSYGGVLDTSFTPPWEAVSWPQATDWEGSWKKILESSPCNEVFVGKPKKCTLKNEEEDMRRLVKVIIVDPNENVPLDRAVLYMGKEELTDLTDTELFYELEIKSLLKAHNGYRVTVKDKKASKSKDKDEFLEEVRIKDLKMVVLTIAEF